LHLGKVEKQNSKQGVRGRAGRGEGGVGRVYHPCLSRKGKAHSSGFSAFLGEVRRGKGRGEIIICTRTFFSP